MKDLEVIEEYRNMKNLTEICREFGSDRSNLLRGHDKKNEKKVANVCKYEIMKLASKLILEEQEKCQ